MFAYPFVVNDKPYCLWADDIAADNRQFLARIDPMYFDHVAHIHRAGLETPERKYSAAAIRLAYSQALETFFALLACTLQAPQCPVGWMLKYRPDDLVEVIRKFDAGEPLLLQRHSMPTWEEIAGQCCTTDGSVDRDAYLKRFAALWRSFAADFLNPEVSDEYNSMKHGLRSGHSGFLLSFGLESSPGVECPPDQMSEPRGSEFGSTFFSAAAIPPEGSNPATKVDFQLAHTARNWNPENLVRRIMLVSLSIRNVTSTLQLWAGVPEAELKFGWPATEADFDIAEGERERVWNSLRFNPTITTKHIVPQTKEGILQRNELHGRTGAAASPTPSTK